MIRLRGDSGASALEYAALAAVGAVVIAAVTFVLPTKVSSSVQSALCRLFTVSDCGGQDGAGQSPGQERSPGQGQSPGNSPGPGQPTGPGQATGPVPSPGVSSPSPEEEAYNRAKNVADTANRDLNTAEGEFDGLQDELIQFLEDLIGITDAKKCLTEGDIIACIETAANAIPWGKAFKLLRKLPKAFKLARRFKSIWDKVSAARKKRDEAQQALRKAEDDLRHKRQAEKPKSCPLRRPPTPQSMPGWRPISLSEVSQSAQLVALRDDPAPTPSVDSDRLRNLVESLYRGTGNPDRVGDGTAMAAASHEAAGGSAVEGRNHVSKAEQMRNALQKFLTEDTTRLRGGRRVPNTKTAKDRQVAEALINALDDAVAGRYKGFTGYQGLDC